MIDVIENNPTNPILFSKQIHQIHTVSTMHPHLTLYALPIKILPGFGLSPKSHHYCFVLTMHPENRSCNRHK